jgi:hypothetical protein
MMSRESEKDVQAAGLDVGFLQQPGRIYANFSDTQRILKQPIRIPANFSGNQRTQSVNRKVAGSSPASGATFLNTDRPPLRGARGLE